MKHYSSVKIKFGYCLILLLSVEFFYRQSETDQDFITPTSTDVSTDIEESDGEGVVTRTLTSGENESST